MGLSIKQRRFVDEYLVDGNGTAAAVRAGYGRAGARVTACRLLKNANVMAQITDRQAADAARLRLQREDALRGLLEAVELARLQANPAAQISAWREIGRMLGFYTPERHRVELSPAGEVAAWQLEAKSDEELVAMASGGV